MRILANLIEETLEHHTPITKVSLEMFENPKKFGRHHHATMQVIHKGVSTSATREMQRHPIDSKFNRKLQEIQDYALNMSKEHERYVNKPVRSQHRLYPVLPKDAQ